MPKSPHARPLQFPPQTTATGPDHLYPEGEVFSPSFVKACPSPAVQAYLRSLAWEVQERQEAERLSGPEAAEPPPFPSEAQILDQTHTLRCLAALRFAAQIRAFQAPALRAFHPPSCPRGGAPRATG